MSKKKEAVFCQRWIESERNWGRRPDGVSLHLSRDDAQAFAAEYWNSLPTQEAPDAYSLPEGRAFLVLVEYQIYEQLLANAQEGGFGHRYSQADLPQVEH